MIHPFFHYLILVAVLLWQGLMDWIESSVLKEGLISPGDLDIITVTDDIDEVVKLISNHRLWKQQQIDLAKSDLN